MNFPELVIWFFLYCVFGWIFESIYCSIKGRKVTNRGFLNGPYIPIYGFGAMLYVFLLQYSDNPIYMFVFGGLLAVTLEYITSWGMEKLFHARWWDYSDNMLNINGRICLSGWLCFSSFAVLIIPIHKLTTTLTGALTEGQQIAFMAIILAIMLTDAFITVKSLINLNKILSEYQKQLTTHSQRAIEFIRASSRSFFVKLGVHLKPLRVLNFQQRRIFAAFPNMRPTRNIEAFKKLQLLNIKTREEVAQQKIERKTTKKKSAKGRAKSTKKAKKTKKH